MMRLLVRERSYTYRDSLFGLDKVGLRAMFARRVNAGDNRKERLINEFEFFFEDCECDFVVRQRFGLGVDDGKQLWTTEANNRTR